jgi:manganese oxidase
VTPVRRTPRLSAPSRALLSTLALLALIGLAVSAQGAPVRGSAATGVKPATGAAGSGGAPSGHQGSEGFVLAATGTTDGGQSGPECDPRAPVRRYDVVAIDVDITVNRYLDHDPRGRMYVLEADLARVRQEEAQNARARDTGADPAVSLGLQGDAIQPLVLRVVQGECLRIRLRNALGNSEAASLHLHGANLQVAGANGPAIATNPLATARAGETVTYEWMVDAAEPEGTHYFHSHGDDRFQTDHGLFGAVIVEQRGSTWIDPLNGAPLRIGWAAIVRDAQGKAFREFVLFYHEIGDEAYQLVDKAGQFTPIADPITRAYRPDGRALNYRSEPFMNRLALEQQIAGTVDESIQYSSYGFGDPATPIMRSYLGDPVKQRVVHGGSEVFHVHHVHGGAVRWRRQPGVEPSAFDTGLDKHPPLDPQASQRTDSQTIGPSETFDIADECGSGGCQQSAGDFMYHCHVTHHYFAGMWGIWRVYDTRQVGPFSTDSLPPLQELPDRLGHVAVAVTSDQLVGRTVSVRDRSSSITAADLATWVEQQLPPQGVPSGYDASVFDWQRTGNRYLGETETSAVWPGYRSPAPATRPPLLFDPRSGRLAYPALRPHLGKRPPFAPNHGPAPFLDTVVHGTDPPSPGENGQASECPAGTTLRTFAVNAISVPVPFSVQQRLLDPLGELYVLREQEDAVRADPHLRVPLVIRANAGEDCVDVILRNELGDIPGEPFNKVSLHVHFVQFDVQASDGVDAGFNYEQTIRPFRLEGSNVVAPVAAGAIAIRLGPGARFQPGAVVGVGMDQDRTFEVRRIASTTGDELTFDGPLVFAHAAGEVVSTEFVRYRWYPDVSFGTALFHDHVNVLESGQHGLFGALISEPPGSTYHDPHGGALVRSGPLADIYTDARISVDTRGSFRELVLLMQDDNPLTHVGRSSGSSIDLRVAPVEHRARDPSATFSSAESGDPETPLLEAYLGDPITIRTVVGANNDVHTLHVDGHWFRIEPFSASSPTTDTVDVGISERYDLVIPHAGGPQRMPGDYLYYDGRSFKLREGDWGILRVHDASSGEGLHRLPGHENVPRAASTVCPPQAPRRAFAVTAVEVPLPMLGGDRGKVYVLDADRDAVTSGRMPASPLVLHAGIGDCIVVNLSNATSEGLVSFHADMLAYDPLDSGGVAAGHDPLQAVAPGASRTYTFYAHPEVGETTALVRDWGDVLTNPAVGLYGAVVIGPAGARYTDPSSGADLSAQSSWQVDVQPRSGRGWRDFTLFMQDADAAIGTHRMPYSQQVDGVVGLNYRAAPLSARRTGHDLPASVYGRDPHGDPGTPLMEAYAGDPVAIHVLEPWSEQEQVFSVEGHRWPLEPGRKGTNLLSSQRVGASDAVALRLDGGAGSAARLPGDYVYGDHRGPYTEAGLWGLFRVHPACPSESGGLRSLSSPCSGSGVLSAAVLRVAVPAAVGTVAIVTGTVWVRRRRRAA